MLNLRYSIFFTVQIILLLLFVNQSYAVSMSKIEELNNKTLFIDGKLDRFYFGNNRNFFQQLEEEYQQFEAGDLLEGTWSKKKSDICLRYNAIPDREFCYSLDYAGDTIEFLDKDDITRFKISDIQKGNWLLSKTGMRDLIAAHENPNDTELLLENNYDINFVEYVYENEYSIDLVKSDTEGVIYNKKSKAYLPYKWRKDGLRIIGWVNDNDLLFNSLFTKGQEFLKQKESIIQYISKDKIIISDNDFTLTPMTDYNNKNVFSNADIP